MSGIAKYTGAWTVDTARHLARRTLFGATKGDVLYFLSQGMDASVAELLTAAPTPSAPVNYYQSLFNDPNVPYGSTWVNQASYPPPDPNIINYRREALYAWWMGLIVNQNRSLTEKMTLFWHNHFAVEMNNIPSAEACYKYVALLRQHALLNFKSLTKSITLDPAMLYYLNGYLNSSSAPDENYARELQELFTLGKGPNSQYTEDDVKAAARVLTGHRINPLSTPVSYYFDSNQHDATNKTFSSFFNNTVIQGQIGVAGANEVDDLLNMIFANNEVALYIVRRLYIYFVYYKIDSSVETNVIEPLAAILRANNYNIAPVLDTLFKSEHFYDLMSKSCVIKSPIDYIAGLSRVFNFEFPSATDYENIYSFWKYGKDVASVMGQSLGNPPSVSGWPAYYQIPSFHELWINSDYFGRRVEAIETLLNTGYTYNGFTLKLNILAFVNNLDNPQDPNALVTEAVDLLLALPLSQTGKDYYKSILLSGQTQDYYWTDAWNNYKNTSTSHPDYPMFLNIVQTRLTSFFTQLLKQPEFQLS